MSAVEKVQGYTGREVLEVREWAYVYWVRFAHSPRPTMLSKKIVDRAAEIRIGYVGADYAAKDERTGRMYLIRKPCYGVSGFAIKEVTEVTQWSTFDNTPGKAVEGVASWVRKPSSVREIMVAKAMNNEMYGVAA